MADRFDFYFRQKVTESELDGAFAAMEQADFDQFIDHGLTGLVEGLDVSENAGTPNLTVDIAAGTAYSKAGERMRVGAQQDLDVSVDDSAVSTAVGSGGNEKIVSVFILFDRVLTDPRLDGNSVTVFFSRAESFQFSVVQGPESVAPATPPALDPDKILLADITRTFGQTQIFDGDISFDRRETVFNIDVGNVVINTGRLRQAVTDIAQALDDHITGVGAAHPTSAIDGAADTVGDASVTATTLDAQINEILAEINDRVLRAGDTITGALQVDGAVDARNRITLGADLLGSEANGLIARIKADGIAGATGERVLLSEHIDPDSTTDNCRVYISGNGGLEIVINATWDGSNWNQDNGAGNSTYMELKDDGIRRRLSTPGFNGGSWADAGWERTLQRFEGTDNATIELRDGRLIINDTGTGIPNSNPPHTNAPSNLNTFMASTIPKAYGRIEIGVSGTVDFTEGYNFDTPANPGASSIMTIPFDTAFDDGEYTVVLGLMTAGDFAIHVTGEATGQFQIVLRTMSTGATLGYDSTGGGIEIGFAVFGKVAS